MSKLETNTIDNISGSTTLTIGDSNASTISIPKNITLGASGTTITVPSGATITNNGTQTGFGGTNTPAFMSQISANQSVSHDTQTKINFNTKIFDTDTNFDTTNKRFTPTTAGKYFLSCNVSLTGTNNRDYFFALQFFKNGSEVFGIQTGDELSQGTDLGMSSNCIVDFNGSSDYVEMYMYSYDYSGSGGISLIKGTQPRTFFHGYKIIGA